MGRRCANSWRAARCRSRSFCRSRRRSRKGLARAHEAGIVHRDLKPENVMVKKDGLVKILDFGLAKLSSTGSGSDEASQLPTMTGTQPGVVVGTVSYMSPEQASGQTVDFRSDQFSLGSMLYEMATGKRAFQKKTAIDTLAAILNEEPEPIAVGDARVPAPLRWIVERCLAKEPRQRYGSTEDLARDLSTLRDHLSESISSGSYSAAAGSAPRRRVSLPALGAIAAALALVAVGVLAHGWLAPRESGTEVPSVSQVTFRRGNVHSARFAPDGRTVVYLAAWDGKPIDIFTVRTDSMESRSLGLPPAELCGVSSRGELAILLKKGSTSFGSALWRGFPSPAARRGRFSKTSGMPTGLPMETTWRFFTACRTATRGSSTPSERPSRKAIRSPAFASLREEISLRSSTRRERGHGLHGRPGGKERRGFTRVVVRQRVCLVARGGGLILVGARPGHRQAVYAVSLSGRERVLANIAHDMSLYDVASDGRLLVEYFRAALGHRVSARRRGSRARARLA